MHAARFFLACAALLGGGAVGLGAFAAHGLRGRLEPRALEVFQTGVQYQLVHALALLALALAGRELWASSWTRAVALAWTLGTLVFSGSLYALALGAPRVLGAVTPVGGLLFIIGWLLLLAVAVRAF